jgi:hypothetical protein
MNFYFSQCIRNRYFNKRHRIGGDYHFVGVSVRQKRILSNKLFKTIYETTILSFLPIAFLPMGYSCANKRYRQRHRASGGKRKVG